MEQLDTKFPSNTLSEDNVDIGTTKTGEVPVNQRMKLDIDIKETKLTHGCRKIKKLRLKVEEYRTVTPYTNLRILSSRGQNHHRMWILRLMIFLHGAMYSTMFR